MSKQRTRYVRCLSNQPYVSYIGQPLPKEPLASLVVGRVYKVAPPEENDGDLWRVIDETGEAYLYPTRYFEPLNLTDTTLETVTLRVPTWLKGIIHAEAVAAGRSMSMQLRNWLIERQSQDEISRNNDGLDPVEPQTMSDSEYLLAMAGMFRAEPSDTSEKVSQIVAAALLEKYERSAV
jgi:hypothetical protein